MKYATKQVSTTSPISTGFFKNKPAVHLQRTGGWEVWFNSI